MERRRFLTLLGGTSLVGIAGCTEEGPGAGTAGGQTTTQQTTSESGGEEGTAAEQTTASDATTQQQTTASNGGSSGSKGSYSVHIVYDGEWAGSIATADSSRSVEGTGEKTIDIEGDTSMLSANAQKMDDGSGTLKIQILKDGEVVQESSTSAEYGVAQVSTSDWDSGSGSDSSKKSPFSVKIMYDGNWSGSIGGDGSIRSVDGSGTETFDIKGNPTTVSANAQKQDGGGGTLTIQILKDGEVVKEASTSAEYGVASVTYSNF